MREKASSTSLGERSGSCSGQPSRDFSTSSCFAELCLSSFSTFFMSGLLKKPSCSQFFLIRPIRHQARNKSSLVIPVAIDIPSRSSLPSLLRYFKIEIFQNLKGFSPALKINCGPPTANLWSDWSPQKHVNRVKSAKYSSQPINPESAGVNINHSPLYKKQLDHLG